MSTPELHARFRQLHASGCFVIPNPWDFGSAVLLEQLGFRALALERVRAAHGASHLLQEWVWRVRSALEPDRWV